MQLARTIGAIATCTTTIFQNEYFFFFFTLSVLETFPKHAYENLRYISEVFHGWITFLEYINYISSFLE